METGAKETMGSISGIMCVCEDRRSGSQCQPWNREVGRVGPTLYAPVLSAGRDEQSVLSALLQERRGNARLPVRIDPQPSFPR